MIDDSFVEPHKSVTDHRSQFSEASQISKSEISFVGAQILEMARFVENIYITIYNIYIIYSNKFITHKNTRS